MSPELSDRFDADGYSIALPASFRELEPPGTPSRRRFLVDRAAGVLVSTYRTSLDGDGPVAVLALASGLAAETFDAAETIGMDTLRSVGGLTVEVLTLHLPRQGGGAVLAVAALGPDEAAVVQVDFPIGRAGQAEPLAHAIASSLSSS